jgi:Clp amino terminal domain, pathogenicity island component
MAFERFTSDARAAVVGAREQALTLGHHTVESEHLLLALASRPEFAQDRRQSRNCARSYDPGAVRGRLGGRLAALAPPQGRVGRHPWPTTRSTTS